MNIRECLPRRLAGLRHWRRGLLMLPALLGCDQAWASDHRALQLSGILRPVACQPRFSNDGVVDFGTLPVQAIAEDAPARLDKKTINLSIDCVAPTRIAVAFSTHRFVPGVRAAYGMSRIGAQWVGSYDVNFETGSAVADGKPMQIFYARRDNGQWQHKRPGVALTPAHRYAWRTATDLAAAASTFTVDISVQPTVTLGDVPTASGPVPASSSATVDVLYP